MQPIHHTPCKNIAAGTFDHVVELGENGRPGNLLDTQGPQAERPRGVEPGHARLFLGCGGLRLRFQHLASPSRSVGSAREFHLPIPRRSGPKFEGFGFPTLRVGGKSGGRNSVNSEAGRREKGVCEPRL